MKMELPTTFKRVPARKTPCCGVGWYSIKGTRTEKKKHGRQARKKFICRKCKKSFSKL